MTATPPRSVPVTQADREALVSYAMHYGPRCRDCADENGTCPMSGMPCGERRKATEFVVDALMYGAAHGYCPTSLAAASVPAADERVTLASLRAAAGLSLRDVKAATANRVSDALLSQYETGKIKRPSATVLIDLAGVYGVPVNTVFEAAEVNPAYVTGESEHRSDALGRPLATLAAAPIPTTSQADVAGEVERDERFWLIVHEPGKIPVRKGPWRHVDTAKTVREFIAAYPTAYIHVLTNSYDGPWVEHGPEAMEMVDGRYSPTARQHNARTRAAHQAAHPSTAGQEDQSRG